MAKLRSQVGPESNPQHVDLVAGTPHSERGSLLSGADQFKDLNLSPHQEAGLDGNGMRHSTEQ